MPLNFGLRKDGFGLKKNKNKFSILKNSFSVGSFLNVTVLDKNNVNIG